MKRLTSLIAVAILSINITACGNDTSAITAATQVAQPQQAQTQSTLGIYKEVKGASALAFREMDKNNDRAISPDEYGVINADTQKSFQVIDKNHDGRISTEEMMTGFFGKIGLTLRLKKAADALFKQVDINKDKLVSKEEMAQAALSTAFTTYFVKYDVQKKTLFHKDAQGMLSKSEFENLYGYISVNNVRTIPSSEPPTLPPAQPGQPNDPVPPATVVANPPSEVTPPQTAPNTDESELDADF